MRRLIFGLILAVGGCAGAHGPGWDVTLLSGLASPACQQMSASINATERGALKNGLQSCLNGVDQATPAGTP